MEYPAFYLSHVQIPQLDQFLLFQTMRGAVDIVPRDFLYELKHFGRSEASALSETEIDTLRRRGYLTTVPAEQEQEQARTILRVLSQNLQPFVELTFSFSGDASDPSGLVDQLYLLTNRMAGEQGIVLTHVEISSAQIDEQVMTRILDRAQTYNSAVLPHLTFAGFEALNPWLKSEHFRQALLISDRDSISLAVEQAANNIINCFKQQVHLAWKCNISDMSPEQLGALLAIFERVRQKYPFFTLRLVSDTIDQSAINNWVTINGTSLPFISPDNEIVLNTLLSFVLAPNRINYHPFFAPGAHKLTCELESKRVIYESPSGKEAVGQLDEVEARFEEFIATPAINADALTALIQERVLCKYALICGCARGMDESADDRQKCNAVYEQRMRQVLPLLLFNLQKRQPRAVAGATSE